MENNGNISNHLIIGNKGESIAAAYLKKQKYNIVCKNYRCKTGEIDIVALDPKDDSLVFVEVKTRSCLDYGLPCQFVNEKKQRLIKKTAEFFTITNRYIVYKQIRMDVFEVLILGSDIYIRHLINAF